MNEKCNKLKWDAIRTIFSVPNPPKLLTIKRKLQTRHASSGEGKRRCGEQNGMSDTCVLVETDNSGNPTGNPKHVFHDDPVSNSLLTPRKAELSSKLDHARRSLSLARVALWRQ